MTNGSGYHLDTTEEFVSPSYWAAELADLAPLLDDTGDRSAFDRLKVIRDSMASELAGAAESITALELADHVLTAGDDDQRRRAMDRLLFWADENRPLDTHSDWYTFNPPALEWIIDGWLPARRIGMLSGQGGRGKSRLALQLAAAVAAGQSDFLGGPSTAYDISRKTVQSSPQPVVYASWEDDRDEVGRRIRAFSASHDHCEGVHKQGSPFSLDITSMDDRLRYVDMAGEGPVWAPPPGAHVSTTSVLTPAGKRLREYAERSRAKILILDPLAASFGSNENDRSLVRAFLANWDRWARDNDCAVLVISHPPKTTGTTYSGSTDWEAGSRFLWTLDYQKRFEGEDSVPVLTLQKSNYGRKGGRIWLEICSKGVWAEADALTASGGNNDTAGLSKI